MKKTKEQRRFECEERKRIRDQRTPEEQLAILDTRGLAAKKERARLHKQIAERAQ
jgi:hypothetical protein